MYFFFKCIIKSYCYILRVLCKYSGKCMWDVYMYAQMYQTFFTRYPAGSGQQSVTGVDSAEDANSYWRIRGKPDRVCQRGAPIRCGEAIRITHMKTGRNLHSHHFSSPLSNHQVHPHNTLLNLHVQVA